MVQDVVYGLDIETGHAGCDRTDPQRPIDPRHDHITRAVLSTPAHDLSFQGDEFDVLEGIDAALDEHEPGILATWNGAGFTLPFLADRAAVCGIHLGLRLAADPRLRLRGEALVGHTTGYRAAWYGHQHLDAARLYRSGRRPLVEVSELLRSFGRPARPRGLEGTGPADVPGGELTHDATHAFAANDARLVRSMIEARLPGVVRHVDRITLPERQSGPSSCAVTPDVQIHVDAVGPHMSTAHPAVRSALLANLAAPPG